MQELALDTVMQVVAHQHTQISDAIWIQLMLSVVTLTGIIAAAVVQILQMRNQNLKLDATTVAVDQVHTVVNGTHSEALRRIELLSGEIRRLNISATMTTPPTAPVTIAEGSGIVDTAPEVMVETGLAPEAPPVTMGESGILTVEEGTEKASG